MTVFIPINGNETAQQLSVYQGQMLDAIAQNQQFVIQQLNTSGAASANAAQLYSTLQANPTIGNFSDVNSTMYQNGFPAASMWDQAKQGFSSTMNAGLSPLTAAGNAVGSFNGWILKNMGNASFIVIGVLLGLGALLISQRETINKIVVTTAKAAAEAA